MSDRVTRDIPSPSAARLPALVPPTGLGQCSRELTDLAACGADLEAVPRIEFVRRPVGRGRTALVPTDLPRLPVAAALATVVLPLHLNWSEPGRSFQLADRASRARVYEMVIREGNPEDVLAYIDGVLLVDLWSDLVLPRLVRAAWGQVVMAATTVAA